jgi:hypothetical protein
MNHLRDFFEAEKKRVFTPGPFFAERVMSQLRQRVASEYGLWDMMPGSTRPVLAVALALILCFVVIEFFVPQLPQRGMVESLLESEQTPAESFLYNEADVPARQVVLQQLIEPEDQQ